MDWSPLGSQTVARMLKIGQPESKISWSKVEFVAGVTSWTSNLLQRLSFGVLHNVDDSCECVDSQGQWSNHALLYTILLYIYIYIWDYMGVSKNRGGPPKWMVYFMENPIKMDDLGVKPHIFGGPPIYISRTTCWVEQLRMTKELLYGASTCTTSSKDLLLNHMLVQCQKVQNTDMTLVKYC